MMNINWEELRSAHNNLVDGGMEENAEITFLMMLSSGKAKKSTVKFKDFMPVFWALSENKDINIITLVVQDKDGKIIYRHKQRTKCGEQIPDGGNANVIQNWGALTAKEKDMYIRLLISQIQGNDIQSN